MPSRPAARTAILAIAIIALDQLTKALVRGSIARGERDSVLPGVELVNTRNTGVAFGLLDNGGALVTVITLAALAGLLAFFAFNRIDGAEATPPVVVDQPTSSDQPAAPQPTTAVATAPVPSSAASTAPSLPRTGAEPLLLALLLGGMLVAAGVVARLVRR